jgi:alanyl-tRNA synthetase
MVHKAFREILGETATQAGSENSPGRFRFDFPATSAVPASTLNDVEERVNSLLLEDLEVSAQSMSQNEAKKIGAMALFGEKYGDVVRVISVGDWARELCGGTHVTRSGQLGIVKLLGESSIGAGVRRVEALVGVDAYRFLAREHVLLNSLTQIIKGARTDELPERISDLIEKMRETEKELAGFRSSQALAQVGALWANAKIVNGIHVVAAKVADDVAVEDLRVMALDLRNRSNESVVALVSIVAGKPLLVVAVSDSARTRGLKAGTLVKLGSQVLGGGGGGKDDFAQGGGTDKSKVDEMLLALTETIAG